MPVTAESTGPSPATPGGEGLFSFPDPVNEISARLEVCERCGNINGELPGRA
jgi:hypothetical protein